MPKGYVIGQMQVKDPETYEKYRSKVAPTVAEFGGRFLVRGGTMESVEGNAPLPRIVVLEFPSLEQARAWYNSPGYQAIVGLRTGASEGHLFMAEGVA
jgi:uncharacterized protein (DUF1330 family)